VTKVLSVRDLENTELTVQMGRWTTSNTAGPKSNPDEVRAAKRDIGLRRSKIMEKKVAPAHRGWGKRQEKGRPRESHVEKNGGEDSLLEGSAGGSLKHRNT